MEFVATNFLKALAARMFLKLLSLLALAQQIHGMSIGPVVECSPSKPCLTRGFICRYDKQIGTEDATGICLPVKRKLMSISDEEQRDEPTRLIYIKEQLIEEPLNAPHNTLDEESEILETAHEMDKELKEKVKQKHKKPKPHKTHAQMDKSKSEGNAEAPKKKPPKSDKEIDVESKKHKPTHVSEAHQPPTDIMYYEDDDSQDDDYYYNPYDYVDDEQEDYPEQEEDDIQAEIRRLQQKQHKGRGRQKKV